MVVGRNNHIIRPSTDTGNTLLPPLKTSFLVKDYICSLMDLVLFFMYVVLMGALSLLIALLTQLQLPNKPKDFKAAILPLAVALVLVAIAFYITVFYPIPPPCTPNTTNVCNYLMSIWA